METDKNLQIAVDFYPLIVYDKIAKYGMPVLCFYITAAGITLKMKEVIYNGKS